MIMTAKTQIKFPTIDMSHDPKVDLKTRMEYWALFLYKHYFLGRKKYGQYGPEWIQDKVRAVEKKIADQSKPYGEGPILNVPEMRIEDVRPEDFHQIYLNPNTPVVFRGMAKNWEAVKKWSPEFFKENYGNDLVTTRLRGHELNEEALRYVEMTLKEVVDNIRKGGTFFPGHTEDLFNRNPGLRESLDLKTLGQYLSTRDKRIMSTQLFLSGGTISGWHCTGGPNLFVMVYGKKEWHFVHPKHSMWMHPVTRKDMFYAATPIDFRKSHDEIEKEGFPLYRYIPKYRVTLEAGDVLFSPHWWWHAVWTPEPSIGIATRAINKLIFGQVLFSLMWVTSKRFRDTVFTVLKSGWGSDAATGAKVAFERERDFISKVSI
jgi:hypothetical protein